jgi:hypothetical protein
MTESTGAIFLSYASQDAAVARRICEALRAAGLEVWFDQLEYTNYVCLAIAYDKLGRRAESDATIKTMQAEEGDSASYQYAEIYAQRGDVGTALQWLDTAVRVSDTGLHYMKVDPFVEPRFQALLALVKFPD